MSDRQEAEKLLLEQVLKLPRTAEVEIPEDYLDGNRHVNMMYYTLLGNQGLRTFFGELGIVREQFAARQRSFFALRQVISYLNELKEGDRVGVHSGLWDFDKKRLHFFTYVVNLSANKLSSADERVSMYIDFNARRATSFEPELFETIRQAREKHRATGWVPELSGAISLKK